MARTPVSSNLSLHRLTVSLMFDFDFSNSDYSSTLMFTAFFEQLTSSLLRLRKYVQERIQSQEFNILPNLSCIGLDITGDSDTSLRVMKIVHDNQPVFVKITDYNYSTSLHEILWQNELAPRIVISVSFRQWTVVVMEAIRHIGVRYVHGNLRASNLLITLDGVRVIDFDWTGHVDDSPR
ncbi:hypothetical protein RCL1_007845 [Eukaryota sp. TZLM3-RCL]